MNRLQCIHYLWPGDPGGEELDLGCTNEQDLDLGETDVDGIVGRTSPPAPVEQHDFGKRSTVVRNVCVSGLLKENLETASSSHQSDLDPELFTELNCAADNLVENTSERDYEQPLSSFSREFPILVCEEDDYRSDDLYEPEPEVSAQPVCDEEALYQGAPITVTESLYSILSYAQSENLSGAGLDRLLKLINLHLPQPNKAVSTTHMFYNNLENCDFKFNLTYYCSRCWKFRASATDLCDTCIAPNKKVDYYVSLPIKSQIAKLLSRPDFLNKIRLKENREKKESVNLEDIYDGSIYESVQAETISEDGSSVTLTLMWYTDGISLYECSSFSLWPFFFVINELPPEDRFKRENIVMAGLWGCNQKPHPNLFLRQICVELKDLQQGVSVSVRGIQNPVTVKVLVVCGTCDSPARADFLNFKSHSGYFSCPNCLIMGEKSEETDNVMVFPHEEIIPPRSKQNYEKHLKQVMADPKREAVCGVKGPTIMSDIVVTPILESTATDGMHCVYLGITKQILGLLFNSKHSKEPYSLHKYLNIVNETIALIQIPHFVQRTLMPVDKLALWKASLCRNFFFYILLIVLKSVMKPDNFENLVDLVVAVSVLNTESVSEADLVCSKLYIDKFSAKFQEIYGKRNMTHNIHMSRHLYLCVKRLGPLFTTSCFSFEDLNGKLANLAHGTRHAGLQIARNLSTFSELPLKIEQLPEGPAKSFCQSLSHKSRTLNITEKISDSIFVIGKFDMQPNNLESLDQRLRNVYDEMYHFSTFSRLYFNGLVYVASSYTKGSRVSSFVSYGDNCVSYGEMLTFVKVHTASKPEPDVLVLMRDLKVDQFCNNYHLKHIKKVTGYSDPKLVLCNDLQTVCFKTIISDTTYISIPLNKYELE
ncbi:hypothetical protein FOCC_FOCC012248 [Frankliniella occidentalis]|nr:hypothetical protein FOCC_FOCC012248 [Frankliniella occidentalis]